MRKGMKTEAICPCCGQEIVIEYKPAKWENEKPKVVITHKKWQPGWREKYVANCLQ